MIRRSRFFRNGAGDGYTHNLYIGAVRSLTVTGSYLWGADVGHELKSRAARNTIVGNRIADRDATSSYSIDLPNGGSSLIAGNVIIQGPHSENSTLVSYGAEGFTHDSRRLWVVNNTFVNRATHRHLRRSRRRQPRPPAQQPAGRTGRPDRPGRRPSRGPTAGSGSGLRRSRR